jgi:DNA-binding NarL/FixJ family response regulator
MEEQHASTHRRTTKYQKPAGPLHLVLIQDHTKPLADRTDLLGPLSRGWNHTICTHVDHILQLPAAKLPSVVIIDTSVPVGLAIQHARQLSRALPNIPLLALLAAAEPSTILIVLKAGATGCLVQPFSPSELHACIVEAVHGATTVLCRRARELLLQNSPLDEHAARCCPSVTRREKQLIHWLSGNLTCKQIADRLGIAPETVHRHAANLYRKYGAHSRDDAVRKHFGLGQ